MYILIIRNSFFSGKLEYSEGVQLDSKLFCTPRFKCSRNIFKQNVHNFSSLMKCLLVILMGRDCFQGTYKLIDVVILVIFNAKLRL